MNPRLRFQRIEIHQPGDHAPLTRDMRRGNIVRHSIDPGLQAALGIKQAEASPQLNVNLLQQVMPPVRVGFVASGEPPYGRAELGAGFLVQLVATIHWPLSLPFT